eukprot:TRINITY_DN118123_c0_g1_i1.p1 TRINITY_DN118123_c0_g1~~TRINITY_DN118123_c0_g1_i1.p1  ORF type:complete len:136 (-),score=35.81 TRINITY_DN118123_c0_g1_i1:25-411(-)
MADLENKTSAEDGKLGSCAATSIRPARSREGWGLFVSGLCDEVEEEDIQEMFGAFGSLMSLQLPLNRMTGNIKGYCMLEYSTKVEASAALQALDGKELRGHPMAVSWLVQDGPAPKESGRKRSRSPRK